MLPKHWKFLKYWNTGEWQVVEEKLKEEEKEYGICPSRKSLFKAFELVRPTDVRVVIIGQDPYPDPRFATGVAFDIPATEKEIPPSLRNMFDELATDCGIDHSHSGDLSGWCQQGVLLLNAYPSCRMGKAGSHHWDEWTYLTKETVEKLDEKEGMVFVLLGRSARDCRKYIRRSSVIETSHPSPLGVNHGFKGSKIFSRINSFLSEPIDWSR